MSSTDQKADYTQKLPNRVTQVNDVQDDIEDLYEWIGDGENVVGCSIVFLKKYGEISSQFKLLRSDFCLIVATSQKKLLNDCGVRTLCVDRVPWNRDDELSITALFAVDTYGLEHTVAFMVTDRSDTYIYEVFFTKLRKYLEDVEPEVLLTPISQGVGMAYRNALKCEVTKVIFSPWQVDFTWRSQLKMIKKAEKRKEVYKSLKGLQTESDRSAFDEIYEEVLHRLKEDPLSKDFHKNWLKTFHKTVPLWANCYNEQHAVDLDSHAIQGVYESLKHKISRTEKDILDCLEIMIKALQTKKQQSDPTGNELIKKNLLIRSLHRSSADEEYLFEEKSDCWLLECETTQRIYEIRKFQPSTCCHLKCPECDICYHTYTCTCFDYFVKTTICRHIHFIHSVYQQQTSDDIKTDEKNTLVEQMKTELLSMAANIASRLDEVNDVDVLCTLRSQLQNSLMLLTYFSEDNGLKENEKSEQNGGGIKRKNSVDEVSDVKKIHTN